MSRERNDRAVDGDADVLCIDFRAATERGVAARCGRDRLQHEPPRQLLGQCGRRELLRYTEDRTRFKLQQARCHAAA